MRTLAAKIANLAWHPFLLVLFTLLALLVANLGQLPAAGLLRPLALLSALAGLLLILGRILGKDWLKGGLICTLLLALLLGYGHVYGLVEGVRVLGLDVGRHRLLLPLFVLIAVLGTVAILRSKRSMRGWTRALNLVTLLLVFMQLVQLAWAGNATSRLRTQVGGSGQQENGNALGFSITPETSRPDIYFIVLDTYTRQDAFQELLGFDNSAFLAELEARGFQVADCSRSNYTSTSASVLASLDSGYLWDLEPPPPAGLQQIRYLDPYLQQNQVMATLKDLGYTTIAFESGYSPTEFVHADIYLTPQDNSPFSGGLTRFESLALQSSAGILLYDFWPRLPAGWRYFLDATYVAHRERILFEMDRLGSLGDTPSPRFVFAHVLAPHTPFVFTRDGLPVERSTPFTLDNDPELGDRALYRQRFVDQTIFLNTRVLAMVDAILAQPGEAVIILQGDHGLPSSGIWSTAILNAIRLPGGADGLYPSITPVNTFRVLFNDLFSAGLPLRQDRSCHFARSDPYGCEEIGEPAPACQASVKP